MTLVGKEFEKIFSVIIMFQDNLHKMLILYHAGYFCLSYGVTFIQWITSCLT